MAGPVETASAAATAASNLDGTGLAGILASIPVVGWWLYRIVTRAQSRDGLEIAKDRAETSVMQSIQDEGDRLREDNSKLQDKIEDVAKERNEAVQQLGKLFAEANMNRGRIIELQTVVTSMASKLEEQTKLLQTVLIENAQLKVQLGHLETLNATLSTQVSDLQDQISKIGRRDDRTVPESGSLF